MRDIHNNIKTNYDEARSLADSEYNNEKNLLRESEIIGDSFEKSAIGMGNRSESSKMLFQGLSAGFKAKGASDRRKSFEKYQGIIGKLADQNQKMAAANQLHKDELNFWQKQDTLYDSLAQDYVNKGSVDPEKYKSILLQLGQDRDKQFGDSPYLEGVSNTDISQVFTQDKNGNIDAFSIWDKIDPDGSRRKQLDTIKNHNLKEKTLEQDFGAKQQALNNREVMVSQKKEGEKQSAIEELLRQKSEMKRGWDLLMRGDATDGLLGRFKPTSNKSSDQMQLSKISSDQRLWLAKKFGVQNQEQFNAIRPYIDEKKSRDANIESVKVGMKLINDELNSLGYNGDDQKSIEPDVNYSSQPAATDGSSRRKSFTSGMYR